LRANPSAPGRFYVPTLDIVRRPVKLIGFH
jgi:hypothetical protein